MPPQVATIVFILGMAGMFWLDRDRKASTSKALWISVAWFLICASRSVSVWLQMSTPDPRSQYLEGSPVDRAVFVVLELAALTVLALRWQKLVKVLRANAPIVCFYLYCGTSVIWSDFPEIAFKRWIKALGALAMVLLVLTDRNPTAAIKRLLARTGFILIPLSVLFIKYIPDLGRAYAAHWDATLFYIGVTTNKNELGMVCLVMGLASLWRVLEATPEGKGLRKYGPRIAHGTVVVMVAWLLIKANSATSSSSLILAGTVMLLANRKKIARSRYLIHGLILLAVGLSLTALFLDSGGGLLAVVGRDATLTGRTAIWGQVVSMVSNPLLGAGYDSFWLGPRLDKLWSIFPFQPNEAHDGYLEIYLQLGWVGIAILAAIIISGYRRILSAVRRASTASTLRLAFLVSALVYNLTEAAFKALHPVWFCMLWAIMAVPVSRLVKTSPDPIVEPEKVLAGVSSETPDGALDVAW
jgi:exopolysaccharide production protein ExoQ